MVLREYEIANPGVMPSWCMIGQVFIIGEGEYVMGNNCWFNGRFVIDRLLPDLVGVSDVDMRMLSRQANEYHVSMGYMN